VLVYMSESVGSIVSEDAYTLTWPCVVSRRLVYGVLHASVGVSCLFLLAGCIAVDSTY
jgi:hypothetical protein